MQIHDDGRTNEFEEPGGNYPDNRGSEAAPTGADGAERAGEEHEGDVQTTAETTRADATGGESAGMAPPTGTDHHGQDGGRDTLTAAQSQAALDEEQEQRLPSMSQNNADDVDKLAGIVAQARNDATQPGLDVRLYLQRRVADSGLSLTDAEIDELARQVTVGDEPAGPSS